MIKNIFSRIVVLASAFLIALSGTLAYSAWQNPTASAPGDNTEPPINVSTEYQYKAGDIGAGQFRAADRMRSDRYCDFAGENCWEPGEDASPVGGSPLSEIFTIEANPGQTSSSMDLGAWDFCALSQKRTTQDDDNNYDRCLVEKIGSDWQLRLTKHSEDDLICSAACLSLSGTAPEPDPVPTTTFEIEHWYNGSLRQTTQTTFTEPTNKLVMHAAENTGCGGQSTFNPPGSGYYRCLNNDGHRTFVTARDSLPGGDGARVWAYVYPIAVGETKTLFANHSGVSGSSEIRVTLLSESYPTP